MTGSGLGVENRAAGSAAFLEKENEMDDGTVERIASICHETNRAYCKTLGDESQLAWDMSPAWQRSSCVNGVRFRIDNPEASPSASHENWLSEKEAQGWTYGETKSTEAKTHPCMMPFDKLPPDQQRKDMLFAAICNVFA